MPKPQSKKWIGIKIKILVLIGWSVDNRFWKLQHYLQYPEVNPSYQYFKNFIWRRW